MNEYLAKCPSFLLEYLGAWEVGFYRETPCWIQFNLVKEDKRAKVLYYYPSDDYKGARLDKNNGKESWVPVDLEKMLRWLK